MTMSLSGPIAIPPNDSYCKIAALKHQIIFTAVGAPEQHRVPNGAVMLNAYNEARNAVNGAKAPIGEAHVEEITNNWCTRMNDKWTASYREDSLPVLNWARINRGELVGGIFAEAAKGKIYIRAAHVTFNESALSSFPALLSSPIACSLADLTWLSCGQRKGKEININGRPDVGVNFCSARKPEAKIGIRTRLKGANRDTKLAVKIVELTIDAYEKSDVGGNVNAVTLFKDGRISWNANPDCPENQD
jgi:hypothetical protein